MPRKAKADDKAVVRTQTSSQPLFVLAGLPLRYLAAARKAVEHAVQGSRVVSKDFSASGILYNPWSVGTLRQSACDFAIQQVAGTESNKLPTCPSRFILAFLADESETNLIEAFDFFCWPSRLDIDPVTVRECTAGEEQVARAVARACTIGLAYTTAWMPSVYTGGHHPAQLPPGNFERKAAEEPLRELFQRARSAMLTAEDLKSAIPSRSYPRGTFPKANRPIHTSEDSRARVFVPAKARHALVRAILRDGEETTSAVMNQIFRFGCPLLEGHHYDVQRVRADFHNERFTCVNEGDVTVTGPYVNIYPNDAVRAGMGGTVTSVAHTKKQGINDALVSKSFLNAGTTLPFQSS